MVVVEMGDQTEGDARQEAANHKVDHPLAYQLTLLQQI
jgi:hypothetical protein